MVLFRVFERYFPWLLFILVIAPFMIVFFAGGFFTPGSLYTIFPLFGIVAWSLMCTQYLTGALRYSMPRRFGTHKWFARISKVGILVSILLHPLLLILQRYLDTRTLPPVSLMTYIGDLRMYLIWIAVVALVIFLSYTFLRPYRQALQKRNAWGYVSLIQAVAMILIFIHALFLGNLFAEGWIRVWWIILNIILLPCYAVFIYRDFRRNI